MILVFGKSGQVAREIARLVPDARYLSRVEADFSDPEVCASLVTESDAEAVINAAAYTAVDAAEEHEREAALVNAETPGAIARACAASGIPMVHISTDYVFGSEGNRPFRVGAETVPINAYGRTKLLGEERIRASGAVHAILRTSWVFSPFGSNFVKTMLQLGESREQINVVADQIGGPTPAAAIADASVRLAQILQAEPERSGTYHFSGKPDVSWADFARAIFAEAGLSVVVSDIETRDYPTLARRPLNSRLDCSELSDLGLDRPEWRSHLRAMICELEAS